jgi:glutamyl-tRNA synthetase
LENLENFEAIEIEKSFKTTAETLGMSPGSVMQLFRVLVSGVGGGPQLFELVATLGKSEVLKRLKTGINLPIPA